MLSNAILGPPGLDMGALMNMANDMFSGMMNQPQTQSSKSAPPKSAAPPADEDVDDLD